MRAGEASADCQAAIRVSRPKSATNTGSPAATVQERSSTSRSSRRSDMRSMRACSSAPTTTAARVWACGTSKRVDSAR